MAKSRSINRKGWRYTATVPTSDAGWELYSLLDSWTETVDRTILTYTLTIGADDLPVRWELVWTAILSGAGRYESTFTTRYRNWRTAPPITVPR